MYCTTTSIKNKDGNVIPFDSLGTQNKLQKNTAEEKKKILKILRCTNSVLSCSTSMFSTSLYRSATHQ